VSTIGHPENFLSSFVRGSTVACPFFMPIERLANGGWPHPARLPLGCGWSGQCTAPEHEGETPSEGELEACNLGYAASCRRLPQQRAWDAVRFAMVAPLEVTPDATMPVGIRDREGRNGDGGDVKRSLQVRYVCERAHRPVEHGKLEFDAIESKWPRPHPDARVQRMAECFLASYLARKKSPIADAAAS
jgi:hypothetical protein